MTAFKCGGEPAFHRLTGIRQINVGEEGVFHPHQFEVRIGQRFDVGGLAFEGAVRAKLIEGGLSFGDEGGGFVGRQRGEMGRSFFGGDVGGDFGFARELGIVPTRAKTQIGVTDAVAAPKIVSHFFGNLFAEGIGIGRELGVIFPNRQSRDFERFGSEKITNCMDGTRYDDSRNTRVGGSIIDVESPGAVKREKISGRQGWTRDSREM